jgi:CRP-like cAMP-binding protein
MIESSALQKYALFGGLTDDQIDMVRSLMAEESYKSSETIITEGTANDRVRFILEGTVAVSKGDVVLTEFSVGDLFGEMEVFDVVPSAATIRALADTQVLSISYRSLREIYRIDLKTFAIIVMNLARDMARRLRLMDERMMVLLSDPQKK